MHADCRAHRIGRGESRFSTWLYQMLLNACRNYRRRQRTVRSMQDGYAVFQADDAADWADSDRKIRWLYLALDRCLVPGFDGAD